MDMSRHPSTDGATPHEAPAGAGARPTPNLPALIAALPGDGTRAPQTEFTRARQVLFLENLSLTGSVRSASAAGGVSHQTAYRARRGQGAFRLAWDAALLAARAQAEATLASRAIDGIEEKVFYHGEEMATRTRYSDRLLLAHLGRLDRLAAAPEVHAVAEDFDEALARFGRGEEVLPKPATPPPAPPPAGAAGRGDLFSPGPCNTRSMSPVAEHPDEWADEDAFEDEWEHDYPPCEDCGGRCNGPPEEMDSDDCMWIDPRLVEMEELRPAGVPDIVEQAAAAGVAPVDVEAAQLAAYAAGEAEWWLAMPEPEEEDEEEDEDADWDEDAEEPDLDECDDEAEDEEGGDARDARDARDGAADDPSGQAAEPVPDGPAPEAAARMRAHFAGRPIDDGRCQPFYGRMR